MPWEIKKCGSKYCVFNKDTGKNEGESDTEEMAKKHLAALYANAGSEAKASYATVWRDGEPVFVKAGAPMGNHNAEGSHKWFMRGHKEAVEFHKPKADYYEKYDDPESKDLAKFHRDRANFHQQEYDRLRFSPDNPDNHYSARPIAEEIKRKASEKSSLKSSSARYRFASMQGGEPVFVLATWSDAARAAAAEARRNKASNPDHVLNKITEHDSAIYSSRDPIQFQAHLASRAAYSASDKAIASGSVADHLAARKAHLSAHIKHFNSDNRSTTAAEHKDMMAGHESEAARINAEKVKAEPKKPFWQETHPNRKGNGFYED